MTPKRKQRLYIVLGLVVLAGVAVGLTLYALRANLNLFYSPQQIVDGDAPIGRQIRAGGLVRVGSVQRSGDSLDVTFDVTDYRVSVPIHYNGILPDLFREGQGVVITGTLNDQGRFEASEVLAKHDEKYMPPEVAEVMKKANAKDVPAGYDPARDAFDSAESSTNAPADAPRS
ncbi:cytochrome c maturation protein CcmE [Phytohalomonas tamaricis]|uniref:cytochrome c maturation protein CcmE n=1 Tax=Phytohalomonas tamaricis TaxID=2081032 RepID=UPI000D0B9DA7|nr:cytochrome c maturation protein CcmE [Phytohalomonas tamaricis]